MRLDATGLTIHSRYPLPIRFLKHMLRYRGWSEHTLNLQGLARVRRQFGYDGRRPQPIALKPTWICLRTDFEHQFGFSRTIE